MRNFWAFVALSLFILAVPARVQANAAPIQASTVHATGNIQLLQKSAIKLEEEVLSIRLDGYFADVSVRYRYFNSGPQQMVAYGFPLDEYTKEIFSDNPRSFSQFAISDESGELATTEKIEENPAVVSKRGYGPVRRRWLIAAIDFPAYSEKYVQVNYRVKNFYYGKFNRDGQLTTFIYSLSPSQYWGDGTVNKFRVVVDARRNIAAGTVMKTMGLPFRDDDGLYVYEAYSFDLGMAGNLVIEYDETAKVESPYTRYWTGVVRKGIKAVRVSSMLDGRYSAENLLDGDLDTAWVEGAAGYGEGEWVEIEFADGYDRGLGIINGYIKNHDTYYKNSRIKKLKLEFFLNGGRVIERIIELPDRAYPTLHKDTFWSFMDRFHVPGGHFATKIRLTVLEVYPGSEHPDTCLTEIFFIPSGEPTSR